MKTIRKIIYPPGNPDVCTKLDAKPFTVVGLRITVDTAL